MTVPVRYQISPLSPEAHLFEVVMTVERPASEGQIVRLPAWIPGSYLIREFARQIVTLQAESAGRAVALTQLDKHSWQAAPVTGRLTLRYQVYCFDLSVRGAYLDGERGFFNGSSVFLMAEGYQSSPCEVAILPPAGKAFADWQLATSLPAHEVKKKSGFGVYRAADYDELIDHPVEMGEFERVSFKACGVPHEFVVAGRFRADLKRLARDVKKICEWQIALFGQPAPFERYVFLLYVGKDVYGGLEHRASTALLANRDDLPQAGEKTIGDGYLRLLGLISHEYFHSWNVKRLKPAAFSPYDLSRENHTRLLWAFEGVTSYYDELTLVRCGLIDEKRYLGLLAETISGVERGAGRRKQTLEESSFNAWTKYYRQDENSPNSLVSYYTKGALAALALDLLIRRESGDAKSLDDVMRALWQKWLADGQGLAEDEWERLAAQATGLDLRGFFDLALRSTADLPLPELLASQGVEMALAPAEGANDRGGVVDALTAKPVRAVLGVRSASDPLGVKLTHVLDGGAAQLAGLSGGDVVVALDRLKVSDLDKALVRFQPGEAVKLHAFRRDQLMTFSVLLQAAPADTCRLVLQPAGARWLKH
ncbi:M61 family metallopeptidase [Pseudogulbenkiania subflava]|uniref:Predicted metalloprotease, contains C-terminal PDZ domain n=1 Tax=Pseudogulbenkiania subflava DSM 22618 TaxID=1123014 RepID=A0A1Y6BRJ7_9NEIS|nr:PDZ domain-containing protein [Pseudogulbenkiania subflava]SMF14167.1 Predicted metalloprotease, contains C-terminal PDZ domain [Pseudogulbenkiania subflava DSM 22618]